MDLLQDFNKGNKFKTSFVHETESFKTFNEIIDREVEKMVSSIIGKKLDEIDPIIKNIILYYEPQLKDDIDNIGINKLGILNSIRNELIMKVKNVVCDTFKINLNGEFLDSPKDSNFFEFNLN